MKVLYFIIISLFINGISFGQELQKQFSFAAYPGISEEESSQNDYFMKKYPVLSEETEKSGFAEESIVLKVHRYSGYLTLVGAAVNGVLGYRMWDKYKNQTVPTENAQENHKKVGYTTAGFATATSVLGFYNFWKMRNKKAGKRKRIIHLALSSAATVGYITAAYKARDSRKSLEDGTARKPFLDLYSPHKNAAYFAIGATALTIGWIIW
ncbi:hypothetical protein ACFL40_01930 [candidate division KSB1 bacterium]